MNNLLKQLIYEALILESNKLFLETKMINESNKPPKWLKKAKKAMYKGKIVKVIEADGPGPMSIIKLKNGKGKTKQVMTKHLSKVQKYDS